MDVHELIDRLDLRPHPEGGFFRETYRSDELLAADLSSRYDGSRPLSTAIYFLITRDSFSAMHRLASDEAFHFYLGDPLVMLQLHADGTGREVLIGNDVAAGQVPQVIVPRGVWQGTRLLDGGTYALLGTTVAPGFDFADFEFADRDDLLNRYGDHAERIGQLTR